MFHFKIICPASVHIICTVLHQAVIKVDEKGAEAAGIFMTPGGPMPTVIDRPFIFILRDCVSSAILFIARG
uniref:Serpin domain-containing protein n=1 Tax=Ignisphaera aggregans TaxID=334771 RepID=A0A7J3Z7V9_9CREN